jgi:TonB family protein
MLNYLLTSSFIHAIIIMGLISVPVVNTSSNDKLEVNIVEKSKFHPQPPLLSYSRKSLKVGNGEPAGKKVEKIDLTDYANQLKALVDPIWYSKIMQYHLPPTLFLSTIVLIYPDKYGMILSVKILKSSGNRGFDQLALDALHEVKQIPKPSDLLVKEGIEWDFSNGKKE